MRFRVTYTRRQDLQRDLDTQLARAGLFVMVPPPEGLQYGQRLPLEIVVPDGQRVPCEGEVLASVPGQGLALSVPAASVAAVRDALARCTQDASDAAPRHEQVSESSEPDESPAAVAARAAAFGPKDWESMTLAEKMRAAQHGTLEDRGNALRDRNRALHVHVLKNPRIGLDEVTTIARNPQMAPEMLKLVADKSEWSSRPQVAEALARNPKTPTDIAIRMLSHCSMEALRQMAKGSGAPPPVLQAARKRVLS